MLSPNDSTPKLFNRPGDFIVPLTTEAINGIVPYGVYLSDGVFAILRNVHIRPEQINLTSSVNVLFI